MLFEESVFIFQFLNNKMHNYVLFNTLVHFIIQILKKQHTFLKTETAKFSRRENLVFILLYKLRKLNPLILTEREETKTRYFPPKHGLKDFAFFGNETFIDPILADHFATHSF